MPVFVFILHLLLSSSGLCKDFQASGLFQAGKEGFPTMPLSVYVPKELVFALFTPLQPLQHLQPKQEDKQSYFLKNYSMTDLSPVVI